MRSLDRRLKSLERSVRANECTCRKPVLGIRDRRPEEEWFASPATDQREALTRRCPLHPNRSQALVVEWPLPKTALDE